MLYKICLNWGKNRLFKAQVRTPVFKATERLRNEKESLCRPTLHRSIFLILRASKIGHYNLKNKTWYSRKK